MVCNIKTLASLALAVGVLATAATTLAQSASSVRFGGKTIALEVTSCSPENSANGRNRAIFGMNMAQASSAGVQFSNLNPPTGSYTTTPGEELMSAGKVLVAVAGPAFDGGVLFARAGQTVKVTNSGGKYQAVFTDLALEDDQSKPSAKKLSGSISCH